MELKHIFLFYTFPILLLSNGSNGVNLLADVGLGQPCQQNSDCKDYTSTTECAGNGVCWCKSNFVPGAAAVGEEWQCFPVLNQLEQECVIGAQCQQGTPGNLSDCLPLLSDPGKTVCSCKPDATNELGQDICYEKRDEVGQSCVVNAQCFANLGEHALCAGGYCTCGKYSVTSSDNKFCLPIRNNLDEPCLEGVQCQLGIPGDWSDCYESNTEPEAKYCKCKTDATNEPPDSKCYEIKDSVEDECEVDAQCKPKLGELSECKQVDENSGRMECVCIENEAVPSLDGKKCLEILHIIGAECFEGVQCQNGQPGEHSDCLVSEADPNKTVCNCTSDATHEPGAHKCYLKAEEVGGGCTVDAQCQANLGQLSKCVGYECICPVDTSVVSRDRKKCLPIVDDLGGECSEDHQCTTGQLGSLSYCAESESNPNKNVCMCKSEATHDPDLNKCFLKAENVGGDCEVDVQCTATLGEYSVCLGDVCVCKPEVAVPSGDQSTCLLIVHEIGGECQESIQCQAGQPGQWSDCVELDVFPAISVCNCTDEGIRDEFQLGNICHKKADLVGDPCKIEGQCTSNLGDLSHCEIQDGEEEGECTCIPPGVPGTGNTRCVIGGIPIGRPCTDPEQCVGVPGSTSTCSSSGVCDCLGGYIPNTQLTDCLEIKNKIGDSCIEKQQCQQGEPGPLSDCLPGFDPAMPDEKVCNCTSAAVNEASQNRCYLKATTVGDQCEVNAQCVVNLGHSQCLDGICQCFHNATESSNKSKCLLKSYLEQSCIDNKQCTHIPFSICQLVDPSQPDLGSVCKCNSGYTHPPEIIDVCFQLATQVGSPCANHPTQCDSLENAPCHPTSGTCECVDYDKEVVSEDRRKCLDKVPLLRDPCRESVQCIVTNSACLIVGGGSNRECHCQPDDYVESIDYPRTTCLPIRREENLRCSEEIQCSSGMDRSECREGRCLCRVGLKYFAGHCYHPAGLGEPCAENAECYAGVGNYSICNPIDHRCYCQEDVAEIEESCWLDKRVGDRCERNEECTATILGPVHCDSRNKICTCDPGYGTHIGDFICSNALRLVNPFGFQFSVVLITSIIWFLVLG